MGVLLAIGGLCILLGLLVSLVPGRVFWLMLFGVFHPHDLSPFGRSVIRGTGVFLIGEGVLIIVLTVL